MVWDKEYKKECDKIKIEKRWNTPKRENYVWRS
jgi:hypothetical protein